MTNRRWIDIVQNLTEEQKKRWKEEMDQAMKIYNSQFDLKNDTIYKNVGGNNGTEKEN